MNNSYQIYDYRYKEDNKLGLNLYKTMYTTEHK